MNQEPHLFPRVLSALPWPSAPVPPARVAALLVALALVAAALVFGASTALAHPELTAPVPVPAAPLAPDPVVQALMAVSCTCSDSEGLTLAAPDCACPPADEDRAVIRAAFEKFPQHVVAEGVATLPALLEAVHDTPRLLKSLRYPDAIYEDMWSTTRSICPEEMGRVFRSGPVDCNTKAIWSIRFRTMLALGYSQDQVLAYYTAEANATQKPEKPFTTESLRFTQASDSTLAVPFAVGALVLIAALVLRAVWRRRRSESTKPAPTPAIPINAEDRAILEDELDDDAY